MESSPDKYRKQIAEAWVDLHSYLSAHRKIERRIQDLRDLIRANANFLPDTERYLELIMLEVLKVPANIGEAVRMALLLGKFKTQRLTPAQVKELAESRGFDFSEYTNPLASITTTLRRLKESDEVDYEESSGSYLLRNVAQASMVAPEFSEKIQKEAMQRVISKGLDPEKATALMKQIGEEIQAESFERLSGEKP